MVANGIFVSKLCYLIQLWGGADGYLLARLQVLQNRAARAVTGKSWFTPTGRLLKDCKWLSVRQLVFYQTVVSGKPDHLSKKFSTDHPYMTRQATGGGLRFGEDYDGRSGLNHSSSATGVHLIIT